MVVYNLEETPDVFITPNYFGKEFEYRMEKFTAEESRTTIRSIDLRKDKLMLYGTEVKESMFMRLYESLVIRPRAGIIYVNCDGACYIWVAAKLYRPNNNVIFDWSSFGVIIPNSVNDSLRKRLEEQEKAVENLSLQCETAKIEVESTKASLKASNDEVNELKNVQNELGLKMQKAYEKVALIDFELELYKVELESSKKESDEVLDELCNIKEERAKMKVELQRLHDQLSSETSSFDKRNRELEMKSEMLENELSLVRSELYSTKDQRDSSNKIVKELEEGLSRSENERRDMKEELQKLHDQLCMANQEVQCTMTLLESSRKEVDELKDEIKCYEKEQQCMEAQLKKMITHIKSIDLEVKASNQQLDQVLISSLWKKLNHNRHKVSIQCSKCGDTALLSLKELGISTCNLEIVAHETSI